MLLKDRLILLLHQLKDHLVVLDGAVPEVGDALLSLKVLNINSLHLFLFLGFLGCLLLGNVVSVIGLKLSVVSCKISLVGAEVSHCTFNDLLSNLIEGTLLLEDLGLYGFDLGVKLIGKLAALIGEHLEHLEACLHLFGHLRDHLDHLLLDLLLIVIHVWVTSCTSCFGHVAEYYYLIMTYLL